MRKKLQKIERLFLFDSFILSLIIINSITIFIQGFEHLTHWLLVATNTVDIVITLLFLIEAIVKIRYLSWKNYIKSGWNKLDFGLLILSLPSIFIFFTEAYFTNLSFLLIFRISRVFKFFRFIKFIPEIHHLLRGIQRALKDSVLVLLSFFVYNFVVSIFSCYLYRHIVPEYFGDPLISFYSTFKIFTIEGWYEIPDKIAHNSSEITAFFAKLYFMLILMTGGIFGLSLVNSIFVDAMVSDNTDDLERKIDELNKKIDRLIDKKI